MLPTLRTTNISPGSRLGQKLRHHAAVGASNEHGERRLRLAKLSEQITPGAVNISMEAQNAINKPVHGPPHVSRKTPATYHVRLHRTRAEPRLPSRLCRCGGHDPARQPGGNRTRPCSRMPGSQPLFLCATLLWQALSLEK